MALTHDQFIMIQHFLPKGLCLIEKKTGKRDKAFSNKIADNEVLLVLRRTLLVFLGALKIQKKMAVDPSVIGPRKRIDI